MPHLLKCVHLGALLLFLLGADAYLLAWHAYGWATLWLVGTLLVGLVLHTQLDD